MVFVEIDGGALFHRKDDWAFLVGHTLGVDHVGHAAVLDSELMQKKLTEVNSMLKDALKMVLKQQPNSKSAASENTLFLVFGDHGMTETGSHGGGSSEEVGASKKRIVTNCCSFNRLC